METKTKTIDLTFVRLVQNRKELRKRNAKAKAYSESVRKQRKRKRKAKEVVTTCLLLLSEVSFFVWMIFEAFGVWSLIF